MSTTDKTSTSTLVAQWLDLWNGNLAVADEIIAPENRVHAAMMDGGDGSAMNGVQGMKDFVSQIHYLLSDLVFAVEVGPIAESEYVVVRWVATGHYSGGIPTAAAPVGTEVAFHGTDILRLAEGKVSEYWLNGDTLHLMSQLQVGAS